MKLNKTVIFKIRIVYKSGYTHDFECTEFTFKNGVYSWGSHDNRNRPLDLGSGEIAAVWQVGYRTKYSLSLKKD